MWIFTSSASLPVLPSGSPGPSLSPGIASGPPPASAWFVLSQHAAFSPVPKNFLPVENRVISLSETRGLT